MPLPSRDSLQKAAFLLSMAVLAFAVGYLTRDFHWFPDSLLQRAVRQGERLVADLRRPPDFTSTRFADVDSVETRSPGEVGPALTLITSTWEDFGWKPGLKLIDRGGRVLHEWPVLPTELFDEADHRRGSSLAEQDIHGSLLLPGGDVVVNVEYAGTVRMDACGRVRWRVAEGNHHSVARARDGSFWTPGITGRRPARSERYPDGYPGLDGPIFHPLVVHISAGGDVLRRIRLLDVLYANGLQRHIPKNRQHDNADVVHLNDVEPLPAELAGDFPLFEAGDLLLSLRNLDLVAVLDPRTGRIEWSASQPFIMQHDPDWLEDGWIGIFDNNWDGTERGTMLGGNRIVAVQPHTDSTRVLFPGPASEPLYTSRRGKWEKLANGNLLIVESEQGRVVEVGPDGRTLWEWTAEPYGDSRVPSVTRASRVDLSREDLAGWPCSASGPAPGSGG